LSKKNLHITIPRAIGDFLNDFGGWKMKIILVIVFRIWLKNIEFGNITIKSVGDFKIKFGYI
jgi:hypothetical protein